jgi:hypothetical protein
MRDDNAMIKLVDIALDALEDELKSWRRIGTHISQITRLVRYPKTPLFTSDEEISSIREEKVEFLDVPDKDVNGVLTRIAMDKAVEAVLKEAAI